MFATQCLPVVHPFSHVLVVSGPTVRLLLVIVELDASTASGRIELTSECGRLFLEKLLLLRCECSIILVQHRRLLFIID